MYMCLLTSSVIINCMCSISGFPVGFIGFWGALIFILVCGGVLGFIFILVCGGVLGFSNFSKLLVWGYAW